MNKTLDVTVVGEVYVDHVMSGFERWPTPGEEVVTDAYVREIGGGAATTACGLGRLGRSVGLMALVGEADASWFEARLCEFSVDASALQRRRGATGVTLSVSTREDRSFFTHIGVNAELAALLAEPSTLATLARARHVHFALPLGRAAAGELLPALKAQGCSVSLDMGYQPAWFADPANRASMAAVDHLIPNEKEAALLCGSEADAAYLRFAAEAGFASPMLKLGARGAAALDESGAIVRAAPPGVEALDTTGAGDAFDAGFIHALLDGAPVLERLRSGCVCGALSTRFAGALAGLPDIHDFRSAYERTYLA